MTKVLGRVSRGGDDAGEESNGTANKHTAMGFRRGLLVTRPWLRVPQGIVRSLEEAGVFTTRSSVYRLLNGQLPYTNPVGQA